MDFNIKELINHGVNVTFSITANDLKDFARSVVEQTKQELEATIAEGKSEVYYTAEQVMSILNVCRRTLFHWQSGKCNKYLAPIKVGGLNRYRKSDIDKILGVK